MRKIITLVCVLAGALVACEGTEQPGDAPEALAAIDEPTSAGLSLDEILAGDHRSDANRARDPYRHPKETLEFFGLRPDMHVVEIWPGGGWYTEVIAPYVNEQGQFSAAHWNPESDREFVQRAMNAYKEKLAAHPDLYGNAQMTVLMPPDHWDLGTPESADMVVTFRNIHNWMPRGTAEEMFQAMYKVLKPGGVLGVVEHRGNPAVPQDAKAASGYVNQDYAVQLAEQAGFVLEETSEINANPADTKDWDGGVWTLPPTLRLKEKDRDKYLAIGESDRFTLRFKKPARG